MDGHNPSERESVRFISYLEIGRLNAIARIHKRNCLIREAPILNAGCNVPVIMALPNMVEREWVTCLIPTDRSCLEHARLDILVAEYDKLPQLSA